MNEVVFVGRIVNQVVLRQTTSGNEVVNNSIAVRRQRRNKEGNYDVDFIPFTAWNQHARILDQYVKKGDQIALKGRMISRSYVDKDKTTRYVVECVVETLTLLNNNTTSNSNQEDRDSDNGSFDIDEADVIEALNMVVQTED